MINKCLNIKNQNTCVKYNVQEDKKTNQPTMFGHIFKDIQIQDEWISIKIL